ncbi:hypothetical protein [Telluribacter sp. SYSU D00476]|uniref:hypothetical protein n=1 Tax=Telluribacter sp. SYSU D00476 TaxID=2811430 RepID=UPI001FF595CB|nr:hypothetical protein [Telluribacter sp. SYSU D00476]
MKIPILLIGICVLTTCTQPQRTKSGETGSLTLDVAGSESAMPHFKQGLLLLHNFEYTDAAAAFAEAQKVDPSFVMAYWGEAMTYNHPVWGDVNIEKARATLQKLGSTPAERAGKARTPMEKDFLAAIEILYGEGSKPDRDQSHAAYMEKVYKRYPGNIETAAFYALSLLGMKEDWSKWESVNEKAAAISKAILNKAPDHPGALHYYIHSEDHPDHARKALAAANKYDKVASYAGHALHMPSHIYLALGMWDDVVRANEVSWQASVDRKTKRKLSNDALSYHAHLWLEYGYLQQGRHYRARQLLENQIAYTSEVPSALARHHLIQMKGHYLFETGDWEGDLAALGVDTKGLTLGTRTASYLLEGTKAFKQRDKSALARVIQALESDLAKATLLRNSNTGIPVCGVSRFVESIPSELDIREADAVKMELMGLQAWANNDMKAADSWLQKATAQGEGYLYGPPGIFKPMHEVYGEFLLAADRPQEAYRQFETSLKMAPNRIQSLQGKLQSAQKMKDIQKETEVKEQLEGLLKQADEKVRKG